MKPTAYAVERPSVAVVHGSVAASAPIYLTTQSLLAPNAAVTSGTEGIICSQEQAPVLGATAFIRTITDGIYDVNTPP